MSSYKSRLTASLQSRLHAGDNGSPRGWLVLLIASLLEAADSFPTRIPIQESKNRRYLKSGANLRARTYTERDNNLG